MENTENRYIEAVKEFHNKFGHPIGKFGEEPDTSVTTLRFELLHEELGELATALIKKDGTEVVDALVDLQYVLSGTVVAFGLQDLFAESFEEVHASNMSKLGENGKPIYREDGKILKGPNYFKPRLCDIIKDHLNKKDAQNNIDFPESRTRTSD